MSKVKNKRVLKKIAQDWCKSILLANDMASFDDDLLTQDEQAYIVDQCHKIAESLSDRPTIFSLPKIIEQYYEIEQRTN